MGVDEAAANVLVGHQSGCCNLCGGHRKAIAEALRKKALILAALDDDGAQEPQGEK